MGKEISVHRVPKSSSSIQSLATVKGDTKAPKIVPPPKIKDRLGCECFDSLIDIRVGQEEEEQIFQVHKGVLRKCSTPIKKILDDGMNSKWSYQIEIREADPEVFAYFHRWLYTDNIAKTGKAKDVDWSTLIDIWIFGDEHGIPDLQDAAMNARIDSDDIKVHTGELDHVYQKTKQGSLLRKYFVDEFALTLSLNNKKWFGERRDEYPPDFLIDVIRQLDHQKSQNDTKLYNHKYMAQHRDRYLMKKAKTPER